jgi:hypothetical protein
MTFTVSTESYLQFFCVFVFGMLSLSGIGMPCFSKIYPSEILISQNSPSSSNSLELCPSSVNVTFIEPVQKNPFQHYLFPPKFEIILENSSVITGFTVGLRPNDTSLGVTRIYFSPELGFTS